MFDSGITAAQLVSELKKETDIAMPVPNSVYADSINYVQQMLYAEIIREEGIISFPADADADGINIEPVPNDNNPELTLYEVNIAEAPEEQDKIRFEDIRLVYWGGVELIKSTAAACRIFGNAYAKSARGGLITLSVDERTKNAADGRVNIIYYKRPKLIRADRNGFTDGNIMLPAEFIDLIKTKVRGEVYKTVNEDSLAAKWLNDYNSILESFKMWIGGTAPTFGI